MNHEELLKRIKADEGEILNLCRRLVQIPSENPPGDTQTIVQFLVSLFKEKGIDHHVYAPKANMPSLVARIQGREKGRRFVFNGHLDTFPAGDRKRWSVDPFGAEVKDGKIFGRGVSDMKGGDTASIMAFFYLFENRKRMKGEALLTLVSDEETGGKWGTEWLLENVPEVRGDAVLNGEPGSCDLVHFAEKGLIWMEVTSRGKAASPAYPHFGFNAIQNLNHFLIDLEKLDQLRAAPAEILKIQQEAREVVDAIKGEGATEILSRITFSVGTISGGLKCNLIPDYSKAEVDIRIPHGVRPSDILAEIERVRSHYKEIEYKLLQVTEPSYTPVDQEILQLTRKNAEEIRGHRVFFTCGMNGTDCRHFRFRGIPACFYGPRFYDLGAGNEYITIPDLIDSVKVHTLTAFDFLEL